MFLFRMFIFVVSVLGVSFAFAFPLFYKAEFSNSTQALLIVRVEGENSVSMCFPGGTGFKSNFCLEGREGCVPGTEFLYFLLAASDLANQQGGDNHYYKYRIKNNTIESSSSDQNAKRFQKTVAIEGPLLFFGSEFWKELNRKARVVEGEKVDIEPSGPSVSLAVSEDSMRKSADPASMTVHCPFLSEENKEGQVKKELLVSGTLEGDIFECAQFSCNLTAPDHLGVGSEHFWFEDRNGIKLTFTLIDRSNYLSLYNQFTGAQVSQQQPPVQNPSHFPSGPVASKEEVKHQKITPLTTELDKKIYGQRVASFFPEEAKTKEFMEGLTGEDGKIAGVTPSVAVTVDELRKWRGKHGENGSK